MIANKLRRFAASGVLLVTLGGCVHPAAVSPPLPTPATQQPPSSLPAASWTDPPAPPDRTLPVEPDGTCVAAGPWFQQNLQRVATATLGREASPFGAAIRRNLPLHKELLDAVLGVDTANADAVATWLRSLNLGTNAPLATTADRYWRFAVETDGALHLTVRLTKLTPAWLRLLGAPQGPNVHTYPSRLDLQVHFKPTQVLAKDAGFAADVQALIADIRGGANETVAADAIYSFPPPAGDPFWNADGTWRGPTPRAEGKCAVRRVTATGLLRNEMPTVSLVPAFLADAGNGAAVGFVGVSADSDLALVTVQDREGIRLERFYFLGDLQAPPSTDVALVAGGWPHGSGEYARGLRAALGVMRRMHNGAAGDTMRRQMMWAPGARQEGVYPTAGQLWDESIRYPGLRDGDQALYQVQSVFDTTLCTYTLAVGKQGGITWFHHDPSDGGPACTDEFLR